MIRLTALYPRSAGKKFDLEYYKNHHMPLVQRLLSPLKVEIDAGVPNQQGEPSPYIAVGYVTFTSLEHLAAGFGAAQDALHADIAHYTDIEPIIQISEVIEI